jgi:hypothetical protein
LVIFRKSGPDALYKEGGLHMDNVRKFVDNVSH